MSRPLKVTAEIAIPSSELAFSYVRSRGPGGQNVNKVASKAVLRFKLRDSPSLPAAARARALGRLATRLTKSGELVLTSDAYRDRPRNRDAVLTRLAKLLAAAVQPPRLRRPTRPSATAVERRLAAKRARGERKRARRLLE